PAKTKLGGGVSTTDTSWLVTLGKLTCHCAAKVGPLSAGIMAAPAVAPKAAAAGPAAESLAETVPEVIRRVTLWNPLILSGFVWAAGCAANAVWHAPEAPLTSPELLQEQLQRRIMSIPIPSESPRYQQYKQPQPQL
ncbi:unnamed protein product, partial [Polarella glacialis]